MVVGHYGTISPVRRPRRRKNRSTAAIGSTRSFDRAAAVEGYAIHRDLLATLR
jgi:hypothetical protein